MSAVNIITTDQLFARLDSAGRLILSPQSDPATLALVEADKAKAVEQARQEEREECAKVAEDYKPRWFSPSAGEDYISGNPMKDIAAAIRKRG